MKIKSVVINESQGYKGSHPIEAKHYYENLVTELTNDIEFAIVDVKMRGNFIFIDYTLY